MYSFIFKGVLLYGPPGVGKTWSVRTIAAHVRAKLFVVDGPSIFGSIAGQAEARLRAVFRQARAYRAVHKAPCIVFIDEIVIGAMF